MELCMKLIKAVAVCAVVALAVGATGATAASLITSANIKDGTIKTRDLSPSLQKKIKQAGKPGANGATGATGAAGATGATGANGATGATGAAGATGATGANGATGATGATGANGKDGAPGENGKDGVRYDRIVGSCADDPHAATGEVSIADGVARLGVPTQLAWAQIKSYPTNLKVSQIENLSFTANATDVGQTYMKVTTTNHGSILFDPSSQDGGEETGRMVNYRVNGEGSTVRWNDDAGNSRQLTWQEAMTMSGNQHVKTIAVTAGCALGDAGETVVDDITVNDEVINFE
jgi:hypothetical protein